MIDHNIRPKDKNEEWVQKYIRAAWNDYNANSGSTFYKERDEFAMIRAYMRGDQDVQLYKTSLIPDDRANEDLTYMRINWNILPIIPKFRRMIIQIIKNARYTPGIHAVDNLAQEDRDQYYSDIAAKLVLIDELKKAGVDPAQLGLIDKTKVNDFDELEMEMAYSYKDNTAKAMEIIIKDIFEKNRYEEIRDRLIGDIHDLGVAVAQDYVDYDGEIRTRYVDPSNMIMQASDEPDLSDNEYRGEVRWMALSEIKNRCSEKTLNSKAFKELEESFENMPDEQNKENMEGNRRRVLYVEMKSTNSNWYEVRTKDSGEKVFGNKSGGRKNKEIFNGHFEMIYSGYWVVDSEVYFDCGIQNDIKRPEDTLKEAQFSYNIYAPEIRSGRLYSLGYHMITIADQIQIAYYKVQNAILKARPKGIAISAEALQAVPFGEGEITPEENLDLYNTAGSLIMRFADEDGNPINQAPIKDLVNGLGTEAEEYYNVIDRNIQLLREITGLNEVIDGSSPDPKMLKNVAAMAQNSANNSIKYIHDAERLLTDRVGTSLMNRIMDSAQNGTLEYYVKAVGSNNIRTVKLGSEVYGRKMALYFEEEPSHEEKAELQQQIALALQPVGEAGYGQITLDDAVMIRNTDNLRQAWQYLSHRVKKNRERMEENARARIAANAQDQRQSNQLAEQEKRSTLEHEYNLKMSLMLAEKQKEYEIELMKVQGNMGQEQEKSRARIAEKQIGTESHEFIASQKPPISP